VCRVTRHPVLVQDVPSLQLFMKVNQDKYKQEWKEGKRKAEKDEIVGPNFFRAVSPQGMVCPRDA